MATRWERYCARNSGFYDKVYSLRFYLNLKSKKIHFLFLNSINDMKSRIIFRPILKSLIYN